MNIEASACVKQIKNFKSGTQARVCCGNCGEDIKVISDKVDEVEIQKFLGNHKEHEDCFIGFNDGRRWRIQNNGESGEPRKIKPTIGTIMSREVSLESSLVAAPEIPQPSPILTTVIEAGPTNNAQAIETTLPPAEEKEVQAQEKDESEGFIEEIDIKGEGWISLHRKILKNAVFQDPVTFRLWIYLLLKANHKPKRVIFNGEEITVERGQLVTGLQSLCDNTATSLRQVRTRLWSLQRASMIERKTSNRFSIITILNYSHYQDSNYKKRQTENEIKGQAKRQAVFDPEGQANDKLTTTNNKVNKEKEWQKSGKKEPDPLSKDFVLWFASEILRLIGVPYQIKWGRDRKIVSEAARIHGYPKLKEYAQNFLGDSQGKREGFTIPVFGRCLDRIAQATNGRGTKSTW